jgi:hypothetical protein
LAVAPALPWVHGALVAGRAGGRARLADAPVAIQDQAPRDLWQPQIEEGIDVQLIPEDVAAVGLAVESTSGDAGVVVGREPRAGLEDVRDVEAQQELRALVARQAQVADLPELVPGPGVAVEGLVERGVASRALCGAFERLADSAVA